MKNKIVILDDSVILYQHYIDDEAWEKVLGFPRGGLTYLIQNNNIKFYAYIDYFYRNCLMTMDLPIYIIDEDLGIDGEYSDIEEVTEILNRIFPALNGDIDLTPYLKKREAETLYQHIGDYFDGCNYNSDAKRIEFYAGEELACFIDATDFIKDGMVDSVSLIELSGDTYLHIVFNSDAGKEPIDIPLGGLFDIDNYYTKEESDDRFQPKGEYLTKESGDTFYQPIGDYLTKESGDTIYQPIGDYALKSEIPSLEGYATETWVLNKGYINQLKTINNISLIGQGNIEIGSGGTIDAYTKQEADDRFQPKGNYVTEATVIQYITNLQEQINTIIEAVSGCCSEPEIIYRWITMTGPNDYICSGTTKYAKEKKQVSHDNGITWQDVVPAEYQRGAKLEEQSPDCGYEPVIEYRWITVSGEYVCSGTTKYNKEKKQYRVDGGAWQDTNPLETRRGSTVIETESEDCGYIAPQYRWYQAPASDYICSGTSKYYKEYYQVSYDGGSTWQNVSPEQTRRGALIETESEDCGYIAPQYRWYTAPITDYICSGTTKYEKQYYQVSYDEGSTWQNVYPEQTRRGSVIETESEDCGFVPPTPKFILTLNDSSTVSAACDSTAAIKSGETEAYKDSTVSAVIEDCVTTIGSWSFFTFKKLTNVSMPNTITSIGSHAFQNCTGLTNVTLPNSLITISEYAFDHCSGFTKVNIPNSVETIGKSAFYVCSNITSLTIGTSVKTIGENAFNNCSNLTSITLPSSVVSIGNGAFNQCLNLSTVISKATTPPAIGDAIFDETNLSSIRVPSGSVNSYKTASGWNKFASIIQPIP